MEKKQREAGREKGQGWSKKIKEKGRRERQNCFSQSATIFTKLPLSALTKLSFLAPRAASVRAGGGSLEFHRPGHNPPPQIVELNRKSSEKHSANEALRSNQHQLN